MFEAASIFSVFSLVSSLNWCSIVAESFFMNFSTLFLAAFLTIELSKCNRFSLNFRSWSKSDLSCNISLSTIDLIPVLFLNDFLLSSVVVDWVVLVVVLTLQITTLHCKNGLSLLQLICESIYQNKHYKPYNHITSSI